MTLIGVPLPAPEATPWFNVGMRVDHRRLRAQIDFHTPDDQYDHQILVDLQSRILLVSAIWWESGDSNGSFWLPVDDPQPQLDPDPAAKPLADLIAAASQAAANLILEDVHPELTASEDYQVRGGFGCIEPFVDAGTRLAWAHLTMTRGDPEPVPPWQVPVAVDFLQRRRFGHPWPPPGWPTT